MEIVSGVREREAEDMKKKTDPWARTLYSIRGRVKSNPWYVKKGIKCLITADELKALWIRDKAHELKQPSVDRIVSNGHYTYDNCRYIEMKLNRRRNDGMAMVNFWEWAGRFKEGRKAIRELENETSKKR